MQISYKVWITFVTLKVYRDLIKGFIVIVCTYSASIFHSYWLTRPFVTLWYSIIASAYVFVLFLFPARLLWTGKIGVTFLTRWEKKNVRCWFLKNCLILFFVLDPPIWFKKLYIWFPQHYWCCVVTISIKRS